MIALLRGEPLELTPTRCVMLVAGVGYEVNITLSAFEVIQGKREATLHVHHSFDMRTGEQTMYGCASAEERTLFLHLTSVNGVGPSAARGILSSGKPSEVAERILRGDTAGLKQIKGVGEKTAQRLVVELKDKLGNIAPAGLNFEPNNLSNNNERLEALQALLTLGFQRPVVERTLNAILRQETEEKGGAPATTESLIRLALKALSKG
jgi:Holliday junction DNA helicase RuvA